MSTDTATCQHVFDGPAVWNTQSDFPCSTCSRCGEVDYALTEQAEAIHPQPTLPPPMDVSKPIKRFVSEGYTRWSREIQPQPQFGTSLTNWMEANRFEPVGLAEKLGCTAPTVRKWMLGSVPAKEGRDKLRELGFSEDFWPLKWSQDMFVSSELVQMKNSHWADGMDPDRQLIDKYMIQAKVPKVVARGRGKNRTIERTEEVCEFLFGTRVSDVCEIISKGEALTDWTVCQGFAELIGEPVLQGTAMVDGVMSAVEIRGTWRKLKRWERKCTQSKIVLDSSRARIRDWSLYSVGELLEFHREAFHAKYSKRNEAGELGTQAHKLGQAWIQYHALQDRDEAGHPLIDRIRAPQHFWDKSSDSEEIVDVWLGHEREEVQNAIKALQSFWIANELVLITTEELLADLVYGVAGAVDCVVRDKHGKLVILDWKTSNGVYSSMFVQVTWYARLWCLCHGEMPDRAYIVRLDKLTAAVQVVPVFDTPEKRDRRMSMAICAIELLRHNEDANSEISEFGPEN